MKNIISQSKEVEKRSREWVFILYPESAPADWKAKLKELHTVFVISPIHDKDVDETGKLKKPHHHILLSFNSVKSFSQVKAITDELNQPIPQICHNKTAQIRYFIHLDDKDKFQYKREDIETYGQIDLNTFFKFSTDEELSIVDEILDFCEVSGIVEFFELVDYVRKNNRDWFRYINKSAWLIREYLKSKHFHQKEKSQKSLPKNDIDKMINEIENL